MATTVFINCLLGELTFELFPEESSGQNPASQIATEKPGTENAPMQDPIDDILNRQRDFAKQKQQDEKDAQDKASDQAALVKLWEMVRYHTYASGQDLVFASEWISLISTLTVSLNNRGLMSKLNKPPASLGEWAEAEDKDEPDGYDLAAEIYRQSLIDERKATSLLLEATKLPIWPRVNTWLRQDLHQHVEGRWDANHPLPRKTIDRPSDEFLTAKLPDNRADLLASCAALRKRVNGENYSLRAAALRNAPGIVERLWQSIRFIADGDAVPVEPDNVRRLKGEYVIVGDEIGQDERSAAIRAFNAAIDTVVEWCNEKKKANGGGQKDTTTDTKKKKRIRVPKNLGSLIALKKAIEKGAKKGHTMEESALEFTDGDDKKAQALLRSFRRHRDHPGLA